MMNNPSSFVQKLKNFDIKRVNQYQINKIRKYENENKAILEKVGDVSE